LDSQAIACGLAEKSHVTHRVSLCPDDYHRSGAALKSPNTRTRFCAAISFRTIADLRVRLFARRRQNLTTLDSDIAFRRILLSRFYSMTHALSASLSSTNRHAIEHSVQLGETPQYTIDFSEKFQLRLGRNKHSSYLPCLIIAVSANRSRT